MVAPARLGRLAARRQDHLAAARIRGREDQPDGARRQHRTTQGPRRPHHHAGAGWQSADRNFDVRYRRRRRENIANRGGCARRRREYRQQCVDSRSECRLRRAPHPLYRRRTALGVQVYPPGRRRRPHGAGRLHGSHQRKQDLPPGNRRSQRTGQRIPGDARGSIRVPRSDDRVSGSRLLHSRAAGINSPVRGSPGRGIAAARRSVRDGGWRLERDQAHRPDAHHAARPVAHVPSRGRSQGRHHPHHRRTRARRRRQHYHPRGG